jgi:DNA polymerase-4
MAVLRTLSPLVEPVSVDEAFLDISGLERLVGSPQQIGERAKQGISAATGLTASVGIGPNRLIAKLASDHGKPNGLTIVGHDQVQGFLDPMPVSRLRGVGRRTLPRLERLGIRSVAELRRCSRERLEEHFGRQAALSLFRQARGEASDRVITDRQRKSISKETTFGQDVADGKLLRDALRALSEEVGRIARREHLQGRVVNLKIRFAGFETYSRQHRLAAATNSDRRIFTEAWKLYLNGKLPMKPVRLIGVGLSEWASEEGHQLDLFADPEDVRREQRLFAAMDRVAERFGRGKLQLGLPRKH